MKHSNIFLIAFVCILALLATAPTLSQTNFWQQTNGPVGGNIRTIAISPNGYIFAGIEGGAFRSTNNGGSWTRIDTDLSIHWVLSVVVNPSGTILMGTTNAGIFRSTNNGNSWAQINTGLPGIPIQCLAIDSSGRIFAGTGNMSWGGGGGGGVYRSTNNGNNWTQINSGLTNSPVLSLAIDSIGYIFVGTEGGSIFRSTNNGDSWTQVGIGLTNDVVCLVIKSNGDIFAGSGNRFNPAVSGGVYHSTDHGDTWSKINDLSVSSITLNLIGYIFAGAFNGGVYRSTDNGSNWTQVNDDILNSQNHIWCLAIDSGGRIFAGTQGDGIYRSTNNGDSWTEINSGLTGAWVNAVAINARGDILASSVRTWRSRDNGESWIQLNSGPMTSFATNSIGDIFGGTNNGGVYHSTDNGDSWTFVRFEAINSHVSSLVFSPSGNIFAGTGDIYNRSEGHGIYRSMNNGVTWIQVNTGLTDSNVTSVAVNSSGSLFAGTDSGVFRSLNNGSDWTQVNTGLNNTDVSCLAINPSGNIFAGTRSGGLYRSSNDGENWMQSGFNDDPWYKYILSLFINPIGHIFVGKLGESIYRSTNNGNNWTQINTKPQKDARGSFAINSDGYVFVGTSGGSVYRSMQPTITRSILGMKFKDINGNGIKDGAEPSLQNWRIRLIKDNVQVDSTLTNSSGGYMFSNLSIGIYTVREKLDSGWVQTAPSGGEHSGIVVAGDTVVTGKDFGNMQVGSISGIKFNDLNGNGIKDVGEPGLASWRIRLVRNNAQVDSTTTNSNGSYIFSNLPAGTYTIREKLDTGWMQTAPPSGEYVGIVISGDTAITGKDFGNMQGSISGVKFNDLNRNGIKDGGEPGLTNWRIRLTGTKADSTLTNASGYYSFKNLVPGTYAVSEALQLKWEQTFPSAPGTYAITISKDSAVYSGKDFGNHLEPSRIKLTLTLHDASNSVHRNLSWGVRKGASYGIWGVDAQATAIDSAEDEYEVPSPLSGFFDARFMDPRGVASHFGDGSWTDMRDFLDVAQTDTYKVKFQPGSAGYPMTLIWSRSLVNESYSGSVVLMDSSGNTSNMKSSDSLVVTNPGITDLLLIANKPLIPYVYYKGWNTVSVPFKVDDGRKSVLFPTASSRAFGFDPLQGYITRDTLIPGDGYWLKFAEPVDVVSMVGDPRTLDTLDVAAGWNLIGALSSPVDTGSVETIPVGIISGNFFGYNRGYYIADSLEQLRGYWVKMNQSGKLVMAASGFSNLSKNHMMTNSFDLVEDLNRLTLRDASGNEQVLYFLGRDAKVDMRRFELPPVPPSGVFDARFTTGYILATSGDGGSEEFPIQISSAVYPITISWTLTSQNVSAWLEVDDKQIHLKSDGKTRFLKPTPSIVLRLSGSSNLPKEFALEQNYPNPFNPTTVIKYELPEPSRVIMKIFNVLGQEVKELVNEIQEAGYKWVEWNSTDNFGNPVGSAVYFCRMEVNRMGDPTKSFILTKKLVLIR